MSRSLFDDPEPPQDPTSSDVDTVSSNVDTVSSSVDGAFSEADAANSTRSTEEPFPELNAPTAPPTTVDSTVSATSGQVLAGESPLPKDAQVATRDETPSYRSASRLSDASLRSALEQQSRAAWTAFFGVLLILTTQLLFVVPALELGDRQRRLAGERQKLSDLEPRLSAMREPMEALRQRVAEGLRDDLERFLTGLEDDFARLDLAVDEVRVLDSSDGSVPLLDAPKISADRVDAWVISDAELRFDIARATSSEDLQKILAPLIDEQILRPRFGKLNSAWKAAVLPHVEARVDGLASDLSRLRGALPEADQEWSLLASTLSDVRRQARELEIEAPSESGWWATVEEPDQLALRLADATRQRLLAPLALDDLNAALGRLFERDAAVVARLENALVALPAPGFALGQGLRVITPGWPALAALFPALLGLLLAALSLWRSRSLFAMGRALELFPDPRSILWLRSCLAGGASLRPRGLSWAYLRTVLAAVISALWIGLSAWHQNRAGDFADSELLGLLAVGGGCVFGAAVYRLLSLHAVWAVDPRIPRPSSGPRDPVDPPEGSSEGGVDPDLPSPDDRQTGFLDLHTLRH